MEQMGKTNSGAVKQVQNRRSSLKLERYQRLVSALAVGAVGCGPDYPPALPACGPELLN